MSKFKKIVIVSISAIVIFIVVLVLLISPITKYLIEKYDEKYTGRQITLDWSYVNIFTGYLHLENLQINEFKSDSAFFSADGISVNLAMLKLLNKTYEISEFTLTHPKGVIIQNKKKFNFDDLIEKFSSKEEVDTTKAPVHFNILDVNIVDGEFYFREKLIPIDYFIKNVNVQSDGKRWDVDSLTTKFSFLSGVGSGDVKGEVSLNVKNSNYRYSVAVHKFDLQIINQYLKDLANYGNFAAFLDADVKSTGNFKETEDVTIIGEVIVSDFHFGKNPKDDYASFDKLVVAINDVSPKKHKYFFDSISLTHPYFKYERYDYLDNVQTMFGTKGSNLKEANSETAEFNLIIEIAKYIKELSNNFFRSDYKVNRLALYNGDIKYSDFSINEKFSVKLNPLLIIADSINKSNKRVRLSLKSGIKPYGDLAISISINPNDSSYFDLNYQLQKMPVAMLNPYIISFTSFPMDKGTIEVKGAWHVKDGNIQSKNRLTIIDPRISNRIKNKNTKWIPMRLAMAFIRERGNVIDYEVPIKGNLNDPKFKFRDVIFDILKNIFVKPVTTSYGMEVRSVETEIEKSLALNWEMRSSTLTNKQEKFIEKIIEFLKENPDVNVTIDRQNYTIKEKEYILFFEAKKKYFLTTNNIKSFTEADSEKVDIMSVKDSLFVKYLNKQINNPMIFTIQEKCMLWIGNTLIDAKFKQLLKERENVFMTYFKKSEVDRQVKIARNVSVIPYNGFSLYEIKYEGKLPTSLIEAYQEMDELDNEKPRDKFKKERKKNTNNM